MTEIIMTNSFRGGTGKSTIISNLGSYLASYGLKVIIIDADTVSPGVHAIFGLSQESFSVTVTDYLNGSADIQDTVYDISQSIELPDETLYLAPSSILKGDIAELLKARLTGEKLVKALPRLVQIFNPDYILIDTHPGLNEEVLVAYEAVDIFLNIARPDNQDYQGLEVTSSISEKLKQKSYIILNRVHHRLRNDKLKKTVEKAYGVTVAGMLPESEEVILSQSQLIFTDKYPEHEFSREIRSIANTVFGVKPREHLELMHEMLGRLKKIGPATYARLEQEKNIYIPRAKEYFDELINREFISQIGKKGAVTYSVSDKGEKFLKKYNTIKRFVTDFRL